MKNYSWLVAAIAIITVTVAVAMLGWVQIGGQGKTGFAGMQRSAARQALTNEAAGAASSYLPTTEVAPQGMIADMGKRVDSSNMISPIMPMPIPGFADAVQGGEMLLQEASLSLVSQDPTKTEQDIRRITQELGGFLLTSQVSRPEEGASATVVVRVPSDKLSEAMAQFAAAGQRVLTTEVHGQDITQQYQDIDARLATLAATQAKLEDLFEAAQEVDEILLIQQRLSAIQDQKDALEGQKRYLAEASKLARVTLYIASDELALPYAPAQPWRPQTIFKMAVRSVVGTLRSIGTLVIWVAVYLPLILVFALPAWWMIRRRGQ